MANLILCYFFTKKLLGDSSQNSQNEKSATLAVLLLWSWDIFSQFHSDAYLDPGFIFWGYLALYLFLQNKFKSGAFSFALCILQKGFAALGFIPALFLLLWLKRKDLSPKKIFLSLGIFLAPLILYSLALKNSTVPHFLDIYWDRQFASRFGRTRSLAGLWNSGFFPRIIESTHYTALLVPFFLFCKDRWSQKFILPLSVFLTFTFLFGANFRVGYQYWLPLMPALAIIVGILMGARLIKNIHPWQKTTAVFSLCAVFALQYFPITLKKRGPPVEISAIKKLKENIGIKTLLMEGEPDPQNFHDAASYSWYTKLEVEKTRALDSPAEKIPASVGKVFLIKQEITPELSRKLNSNRWCLNQKFPSSSLWIICSSKEE